MSIVDAASTSSPTRAADDPRRLSAWALSRRSPDEQLIAIELVLAHDFDVPALGPGPGESHELARSVRERYLVELIGMGADQDGPTRSSSSGTEPQRTPVRARGAAYERRASHGRGEAALR